MGTRQHGDDAPEAKVKSQTKKCASTTSGAVGVRLIGMQVFTVAVLFLNQPKSKVHVDRGGKSARKTKYLKNLSNVGGLTYTI